jgi:hypothetical protein
MAYVGPAYGSLAANQAKVKQLFKLFLVSDLISNWVLGDIDLFYEGLLFNWMIFVSSLFATNFNTQKCSEYGKTVFLACWL